MKERLPWFRCFPTALLGAMAGMTPEEGYTYIAVLLRIYETGGPVAETARTLSRRTGLTERKCRAALESLIKAGKVRLSDDGRLDSDSTHNELAWQQQGRENNSKAGKASAAKRSANKANVAEKTTAENDRQKTQQDQQTAATHVERACNHLEEEKEHITPSDEGVSARKRAPSPRDELETVLDPEHADAVLQHRQRIKATLTPRAAKLLAGKFAQCPDPNAAADVMLAAGWRGFEPEWLEGRTIGRGQGPPQRQKSMSEQLSDLASRPLNEVFR